MLEMIITINFFLMENEENMFLSILRLARITTLHSDISADRLFELATFFDTKDDNIRDVVSCYWQHRTNFLECKYKAYSDSWKYFGDRRQ